MKRVLSVFMVVFIAVFPVQILANDEETQQVSGEAVQFFETLDILEVADTSVLDKVITREDLAFYIAKILNIDVYQTPDKRYFTDLSMTSYGTYAVNALVEINVISRNKENKFRPDDPVTLSEIAKILCAITGYQEYAEVHGGFPTGYLLTAKNNDILFDVENSEKITLRESLEMMYEAVQLSIYDISSITLPDGSITYSSNREKTILSVYHDIYFEEGIVTGVYGKTVYDGIVPDKNEIYINGERYQTLDGLECDDLFGSYVKFFYKCADTGSVATLMYMATREKQESIRFDIKDYIRFEGDEIVYFSEGVDRERTLRLEAPIIVYNGYPVSVGIGQLFANFNKGYITVKDMDNNGAYDLIIIDDYTTLVVNYIDEKTKTIYDKVDPQVHVVCADYEVVRFCNAAMTEISFEDITQGDVLSITQSKDQKTLHIICVQNTFNGVLSSIEASIPVIITVADKHYPVDRKYNDIFQAQVVIGNKYYYSLDYMNEVVYVSEAADNRMQYGYIKQIEKLTNMPFDERVAAEIITENAKLETFIFSENIKIDGKRYKQDADGVCTALFNANHSGSEEMAIRYTLDANGHVNVIDTPYFDAEFESAFNSLTSVYGTEFTEQYVRGQRVGLKAYGDSSTVVLNMPDVSVYGELQDREIYVSNGVANTATYVCKVYTENINNEYSNLIINQYAYAKLSQNNLNTKLFMVDRISEVLNSDGDIVPLLKGYLNGIYTEYTLDSEIEIGDIEQGDLVKLHFDYYGNPIPTYDSSEDDIVVVYDYSLWKGNRPDDSTGVWENIVDGGRCYLASGTTLGSAVGYYSRLQLSFGYAHKRRGSMLEMGYNSGAEFDEIFNTTAVKVVVYDAMEDKKENRVYVGTIDDIMDYESVGENCSGCLVQTRDMDPMCLIVYK